jgi:dTMP kinase
MPGTERFISLEGIEGSGKSTQARLLKEFLVANGIDVVQTAEPGGTRTGEQIRGILLEPGNHMDPMTELLLYYASRAQHIREVIAPALEAGRVVITDRFSDSTVAYQGYARGLDMEVIETLERIVTGQWRPSLTIVLDLDAEEGIRRNRKAGKEDRFELEEMEFHRKVRNGFLKIAEQDRERVKVVDASGALEEVQNMVREIVQDHLVTVAGMGLAET